MGKRHAPIWYLLWFPIEFIIESFLYKFLLLQSKANEYEEEDVNNKVVVITGANVGLGKQTAKEMAKRGAIVVMGCRDLEKGLKAQMEIMKESGSSTVELYHLDVSDLSSVRHFAGQVLNRHQIIDILINNAGMSVHSDKPVMTKEGWHIVMATNHLGPFLLTKLLINSITPSTIARIINVSSTYCILSSMDTDDIMMENQQNMGFWGTKSYQDSKLCNALTSKSLAKRYPGIKTFSTCPGFVKTEIFRNYDGFKWVIMQIVLFLSAFGVEQGVEINLMCGLKKEIGRSESGGFFRFGKRVFGVENMLDDELADKVWENSEKLIAIH